MYTWYLNQNSIFFQFLCWSVSWFQLISGMLEEVGNLSYFFQIKFDPQRYLRQMLNRGLDRGFNQFRIKFVTDQVTPKLTPDINSTAMRIRTEDIVVGPLDCCKNLRVELLYCQFLIFSIQLCSELTARYPVLIQLLCLCRTSLHQDAVMISNNRSIKSEKNQSQINLAHITTKILKKVFQPSYSSFCSVSLYSIPTPLSVISGRVYHYISYR